MRVFVSGERNWWIRYPWAAWICTTSYPAPSARRAASTKDATTSAIPSSVNPTAGSRFGITGPSTALTVCQPPSATGTVASENPGSIGQVDAFPPA